MNNRLMLMVTVISFMSTFSHGVTPVYNEFTVDTSLYKYHNNLRYINVVPDPHLESRERIVYNYMMLFTFLQKHSNQVDLFSYSGKLRLSWLSNLEF